MNGAGYMDLQVINRSRYATKYGSDGHPQSGRYKNAGGRLTFVSGPIGGYYGAVMSSTSIGLSTRANETVFGAVCSLQ